MPRRMRKQREDYDPNYVPEDKDPTPTETPEIEDPDIAPGDEGMLGDSEQQANLYVSHSTYEKPTKPTITPDPEPTPDPYANLDETDESQGYVSRSTYDKPIREKPSEPVQEHPIQEHQHLVVDDLVDDDPEMELGSELADDYLSRSTYVLEPTPPKTTHPTKSKSLEIEDIVPEDKDLIDETYKTIYESESTYDVGELGSVVKDWADTIIEKAKKAATETAIVSSSDPIFESDAIDVFDNPITEPMGEIYKTHSTYEVEKTVDATGLYLTGLALSGGVSFVRGAASIVNPFEWARGLHDLTYLVRSPYAQFQLGEQIAEDPLRFAVDFGAAMAGGYFTGKWITNLAGKMGIVEPSDWTLVSKTMPIEEAQIGVNPSTLMPRGTWRKTWEITRQGGTPILGLVDKPGLAQVWLPVPVFSSSLAGFGAVTGLLSEISLDIDDPLGTEKVDTILESIPDIDDTDLIELPKIIERVDETYRQEPVLTPPMVIPKPDPIIDQKPDPPFVPPIIDIIQDVDVTSIQDLFHEPTQIQEQIPKQKQVPFQSLSSTPKNLFGKPSTKLRRPRKTKKRKRKGDPLIGFELRTYKYRSSKELFGSGKVNNPFGVKKKKVKGDKLF